jgi:hypothetical protein
LYLFKLLHLEHHKNSIFHRIDMNTVSQRGLYVRFVHLSCWYQCTSLKKLEMYMTDSSENVGYL